MIQNLLCIFEWSVLWHLYHQTMFKSHLTYLLLWLAINMEMVQMEFWTASRITMLGVSVSMLQQVYQHFQSIFGICFTAQMNSFKGQIMQLRFGAEGSKHVFMPVILCFGSFLKCCKMRKVLPEWEFYKIRVATNLFHKEEDTLTATSLSSELSMNSQFVKELIII